jgi:hypothetical protein
MNEITIIIIICSIAILLSNNSNKSYYDINSDLLKKINILENNYRNLVNNNINSSIDPLVHNSSIDPVVHNNPVDPLVHNNPVDPLVHNSSIDPVVLNSSIDPVVHNSLIDLRDRRVVNDYLYPPINRTERPLFDSLMNRTNRPLFDGLINNNFFNYPTRGSLDTYRQIGIGRSEKSGKIFYLFGRQKYNGSSLGEYYLLSSDKHSGMQFKIPITRNIIKDYYNIPDKLIFDNNHKILPNEVINVEILKNGELDSIYI